MNWVDPEGLFPKNVDEAGECLFGNYQALLNSFQSNLEQNQKRIKIAKMVNSKKNQCSNEVINEENKKIINHLTRVNEDLQIRIDNLKDKCSFFPTVD